MKNYDRSRTVMIDLYIVHAALLTRSDEPAIKFIFLFIRDFYGPVEAELVKNPVSSLPGGR